MIFLLIVIIAGFVVLFTGAGLFVKGAARLARTMNAAPLVVGLTVVAFGTSASALFVNISACSNGYPEIALGNVLGGNIANMLLVLGICALMRPLTIAKNAVWKAIPFTLLAAVVLWVMASDVYLDRTAYSAIGRGDGLILLCFFAIFVIGTISNTAPLGGLPTIEAAAPEKVALTALKITIGFACLVFGARWVVAYTALLAEILNAPRYVLGLSLVALGTSLPGLAAAIMATRRGDVEIAVGSAVGSTIFNALFVLGVSAVIAPLPFQPVAYMDLGVMVAAGIMMFIFMFSGHLRLMGRLEGALALLIYVLYIGYLFYRS
jgi:cation:H+ antiporter